MSLNHSPIWEANPWHPLQSAERSPAESSSCACLSGAESLLLLHPTYCGHFSSSLLVPFVLPFVTQPLLGPPLGDHKKRPLELPKGLASF